MNVKASYMLLAVEMFIVHFCGTASYVFDKMSDKTVGEPSRSFDSGDSQFVSFLMETGYSIRHQNTARKLFRRASEKSSDKTFDTDKKSETNSTAGDNSTMKTVIPKTSSISHQPKIDPLPGLPFLPKFTESCSKKQTETCEKKCSNETRFVSSNREYVPLCGCDTLCNNVFMDCCSDYTKHCGSNTIISSEPVYKARSYLQCETKLDLLLKPRKQPKGVWMIKSCPPHWSDVAIRKNCEKPAIVLNNRTYDTYVPVYSGVNQLTYRNQYCAMCHNMTLYEFWLLEFRQSAIPPSHFNENSLVEFLGLNAKRFKGIKAKPSFYLRYCYFPEVVQTCPNSSDSDNLQCMNGTVEIVYSNEEVFYRNRACSSCHNLKTPCSVEKISSGFSSPEVISRAVDIQDYGVTMVTKVCPKGNVYDPYISKCRPSYQPLVFNSSVDAYHIILSALKYSSSPKVNKSRLRKNLELNFNFTSRQVRNVELVVLNDKFIITFTLYLTPIQSLITSFSYKNVGNLNFMKLLRFQNAFPFILNDGTNLTVYRVRARRRNCIHSKVYLHHEYMIFKNRHLHANKTGVSYEQYEYEINGSGSKSKATVCLKLVPFHLNGSYIKLNRTEYILLPNLTLLYKGRSYDFGEYSFANETVYILVRFSRENKESIDTIGIAIGLAIVNFVGCVLSVLFLMALIVTYLLFKELRTLPGKNLLNLAVSLALADFFWLLAGESNQIEVLCTFVAIATHYFYIVYFTASCVVAYHSWYVFCRKFAVRSSPNEKNRRFFIYCLVTWVGPAVFVALCIILGQTGSYTVNYGAKEAVYCFLGTKQAQIYLFVVPVGVFLLFNVAVFVRVARCLWKKQKSNSRFLSSELQRKRDRENLIICVKLSTLMGFTWLFIFLDFLFNSDTSVFLYLFVLFVSLQGVTVGIAFLVNRKCLTLYRNLIRSKWNSMNSNRRNTSTTVNNASRAYQDTRL